MPRALKITAVAVAAVAAAIVMFVALFDWNLLRGYIGAQVTARTGRELSIDGNLDVDLGLAPRIRAENVRFANADWGSEPVMLDIAAVEFTIDLLALLRRAVRIPEVSLSNAKIVLERNRDGEGNWVIGAQKGGTPPEIGRLAIGQGSTLVFRDPTLAVDIAAKFEVDTAAEDPRRAVRFDARGRWKGMPVAAQGRGGSLFDLTAAERPYPVAAQVRVADTEATVDGTVTGLARLAAADLAFTLAGQDLAHLYRIVGVALPGSPPYRLKGHLQHAGKRWQVNGISGRVGDSDLAGDLSIDTGADRPTLQGRLQSKLLDFDDLGPLVGAPPKTGPGETASPEQKRKAAQIRHTGKVLPDQPFSLEKIHAANADVRLDAHRIRRAKALPIENLSVHLRLERGVLRLEPLNFGVAGGRIESSILLDGGAKPIRTQADIRFRSLKLNRLFPTVESMKTSVGSVGGHAKLAAHGDSVAAMLASADGDVALVAAGGRISNLLLEVAGLDGAEIVKYLLGGDRKAVLRCAVADFDVKKGVMRGRALVVDTSDTNIQGSGTIDLGSERLDLTLHPYPKDKSIFVLRSPIRIGGTLADVEVQPQMGSLAARGGAALALGLLNPLLAVIPLIETGPGTDADCSALEAAVKGSKPKQQGGPNGR